MADADMAWKSPTGLKNGDQLGKKEKVRKKCRLLLLTRREVS